MHPVLFEIGPLTLHTYGLMIALGYLLAVFLMQREARRVGQDPQLIGELAIWSLFLGVLGTRLAHIILFPQSYSWSDPIGWINVMQGGLVFQGAIPAVMLYAFFALRRRKQAFWPVSDVVFPFLALGQAFGRVGCFFYGCCYGRRSDDLAWGLRFPPGSPAHYDHAHYHSDFPAGALASFPVHPTQLYSVGALLLIFGIMWLIRMRFRPFVGWAMPTYFMLYGVKRFIIEAYRGDGNPTRLGFGLITDQQVFSLVMLAAGVALFFYLRARAQRQTPKEAGAR